MIKKVSDAQLQTVYSFQITAMDHMGKTKK